MKLRSQPESPPPPAAQPTTPPPAAPEVKAPEVPSGDATGPATTEPARPPGRSPNTTGVTTGVPAGVPATSPRGSSEPGTTRPGRQSGPNWPRRPGLGKTEPLLTDDKIQIIQ